MSAAEKLTQNMLADETGASSDKNFHLHVIPSLCTTLPSLKETPPEREVLKAAVSKLPHFMQDERTLRSAR
jgi:hypothetical protein